MAYSRQNSYVNHRRREVWNEIEVESSLCGVAYELKIPSELASLYRVFHFSTLKKYIGDTESILPIEGLCEG